MRCTLLPQCLSGKNSKTALKGRPQRFVFIYLNSLWRSLSQPHETELTVTYNQIQISNSLMSILCLCWSKLFCFLLETLSSDFFGAT